MAESDRATASSSGAVRSRCLAQRHLDTLLGGAGDQTSNLPVTSRPVLPPEPPRGKKVEDRKYITKDIPVYIYINMCECMPVYKHSWGALTQEVERVGW